jgi:hypothetical protein
MHDPKNYTFMAAEYGKLDESRLVVEAVTPRRRS